MALPGEIIGCCDADDAASEKEDTHDQLSASGAPAKHRPYREQRLAVASCPSVPAAGAAAKASYSGRLRPARARGKFARLSSYRRRPGLPAEGAVRLDRKSTRLNSSPYCASSMPSSA